MPDQRRIQYTAPSGTRWFSPQQAEQLSRLQQVGMPATRVNLTWHNRTVRVLENNGLAEVTWLDPDDAVSNENPYGAAYNWKITAITPLGADLLRRWNERFGT